MSSEVKSDAASASNEHSDQSEEQVGIVEDVEPATANGSDLPETNVDVDEADNNNEGESGSDFKDEVTNDHPESPQKRKRGRPAGPAKKRGKKVKANKTISHQNGAAKVEKRGRPRKSIVSNHDKDADASGDESSNTNGSSPVRTNKILAPIKKRGRPKKTLDGAEHPFQNAPLKAATVYAEDDEDYEEEMKQEKDDYEYTPYIYNRKARKGSHKTSSYKPHGKIGRPKSVNTMSESGGQLKGESNPRALVAKLCKLMYGLGWASGTGGGMSLRKDGSIYMAPSGVAKEMIGEGDVFEIDDAGQVVLAPRNPALKLTQCAPLFLNAYTYREAGAVLHSHSHHAVMVTLLCKEKEFRITHQEMLKGIVKGTTDEPYKYDEVLTVPIIENTLYEAELQERMLVAMQMYPDSNAVLVRRHGVYIWGKTWQKTKAQAECFHYLFRMACKMHKIGMAAGDPPVDERGITE